MNDIDLPDEILEVQALLHADDPAVRRVGFVADRGPGRRSAGGFHCSNTWMPMLASGSKRPEPWRPRLMLMR